MSTYYDLLVCSLWSTYRVCLLELMTCTIDLRICRSFKSVPLSADTIIQCHVKYHRGRKRKIFPKLFIEATFDIKQKIFIQLEKITKIFKNSCFRELFFAVVNDMWSRSDCWCLGSWFWEACSLLAIGLLEWGYFRKRPLSRGSGDLVVELLQSRCGLNVYFGLVTFRKIAREFLGEFFQRIVPANVSAQFPRVSAPPPPKCLPKIVGTHVQFQIFGRNKGSLRFSAHGGPSSRDSRYPPTPHS